MNPGRLRCRVTLQAKGAAPRDEMGGLTSEWADVTPTLWAGIEPLDGSEATRAMQQGMVQPHRITMRYRSGVTPAQRVKYGTRAFDIRSVVDVEERHRTLQIIAEEVKP